MNGNEKPEKTDEPEMVELEAQVDTSAAKWGWVTIMLLILCITAYKMLKLYYAAH